MKDGDFKTVVLPNGVRVHAHETPKLKTITIRVFLHQELSRDKAAKTALLPMVLRRGTQKNPTIQDLTKRLEALYGTEVDTGVIKIGERHLVFIELEMPDERFIAHGHTLLPQGIEVLSEIVQSPVMDGGVFREDYVSQEKENLRRLQMSLINDKVQYAVTRCIEEMCAGEKYGVPRYGKPEDLPDIDVSNLTSHYRETLNDCPMDIYVVGNVKAEHIADLIRRFFDYSRTAEKTIGGTTVKHEIDGVRQVVERYDVNQAKLALGFRTKRRRSDPGFWALAFCDGILGGFPHSKLFMNVREKSGLAYYAFSRLEATKGLLTVSCGIDFGNFQRALDIITAQVEDMKSGKISDEEMDYTRRGMISRIKASDDSATGKIMRCVESEINGVAETTDEIVSGLESIRREDVVEAAEGIDLDTIYFLTKSDAQGVQE